MCGYVGEKLDVLVKFCLIHLCFDCLGSIKSILGVSRGRHRSTFVCNVFSVVLSEKVFAAG